MSYFDDTYFEDHLYLLELSTFLEPKSQYSFDHTFQSNRRRTRQLQKVGGHERRTKANLRNNRVHPILLVYSVVVKLCAIAPTCQF